MFILVVFIIEKYWKVLRQRRVKYIILPIQWLNYAISKLYLAATGIMW